MHSKEVYLKTKTKMLLTAYKPNGLQAVKPIKRTVNSHKPRTGNIEQFLSLYLEIAAELQ